MLPRCSLTTLAFYHTGRSRSGNNHDGFHHVQLAVSRDLRRWDRLGERAAFIGPSPLGAGAYDLCQILPPSFPIVRGDELLFYYTGIKGREEPESPDPDRGAVCLATLRRDGFVSLDAGRAESIARTHAFRLEAPNLFVNADASAGQIVVRARGPNGDIVATSEPIASDQRAAPVRWREGAIAVGQTIQLELAVSEARLYSFWLA